VVSPSQKLPVPVSCAHLAAIEAQLVRTKGNVTAAATALSVPSADLRKLVWSTASLTDVIFEQLEQMTDAAEQALRDGTDKTRRLHAAVALLTLSPAACKRGWGRGGASRDEPEPQPVTMQWLEH
jgi:hypothetical protein